MARLGLSDPIQPHATSGMLMLIDDVEDKVENRAGLWRFVAHAGDGKCLITQEGVRGSLV